MSQTHAEGETRAPRSPKRKFRDATVILPRTGERVHRTVTLPALFQNDTPSDGDLAEARDDNHGLTRWPLANRALHVLGRPWQSKTLRGIFKCSLAYLLGSLATFVPFISGWLGKQDGKHIVATVTVYFHASRSAGSMIEATICAAVAFVYAAFLSLSSMGVSILFGKWDSLVLGHVIVLVFFLGGGLGLVAWIKQRLANPLVNVACSLTALASITVFVKEGSIQAAKFSEVKVVQVLKMIILGISFAAVINLAIFPESARKKFNVDLSRTTSSISNLLNAVSRAFLNGTEADMLSTVFDKAIKDHKELLKILKGDLSESKWEHYVFGQEKQHEVEADLVKCLQKLSQSVGGLRSAALVQFDLIRSNKIKDSMGPPPKLARVPSFIIQNSYVAEPEEITNGLGIQTIQEEEEPSDVWNDDSGTGPPLERKQTLTPADMFSTFILQLGPSMKSLSHTLSLILEELPFESESSDKIAINENFHTSLDEAIDLFKSARRGCLTALYKNKEIYLTHSLERLADYEEIAASCGHFSYALMDFAEEISNYLELLEDLKAERERPIEQKSYNWLIFWRHRLKVTKHPEDQLLQGPRRTAGEDGPNGDVASVFERQHGHIAQPLHRSWNHHFYRAAQFLTRDDIRFAAKVGIGAALLAAPAFVAETRPTFTHLRLEWGLVSYMVVCSMTIGAVNTTSLERFLGTFLGAALAVVAWIISKARAVPLAFFGWIISLFCFYIIVGLKKGPMGRFIFLTYNLSALYAYSLSVQDNDDDDDEMLGASPEIWGIALHRLLSVMIGCIWAIVITRVIWPISARRKFKEGMALLFLRMGLIWKRDPLAMLQEPDDPRSKYMDIREESDLQVYLSSLDALRSSATSEFELKGPFPTKSYGFIVERTQRMLDHFHGMHVSICKMPTATPGELQVLRYTQEERAALSARISHLFNVLASTIKMEYPLNDVLPNIEHARDRLLARVFDFRRGDNGVGDADYELIYAYVLATGQLAKDITAINKELELLYGTLNEDDFRLD